MSRIAERLLLHVQKYSKISSFAVRTIINLSLFLTMVTYPNAKDEKGKDISIRDVTPEMRESTQFYCWGCGKRMVAVLNGEKEPHFRHFEECECNGESYIHNRGKAVFKETFEKSESFVIELKGKRICSRQSECPLAVNEGCSRPGTFKYNLKSIYDGCVLEKKVEDYRPDVMLTSSKYPDSPLFVEIFHTSSSTDKKLQSGYRLVEIKVDSEDDIERIRKAYLKESVQNVFVGFKQQTSKDEAIRGRLLHVFKVTDHGEVRFEEGPCSRFIPFNENDWRGYCFGILVEDNNYPGDVDFIKFCLNTALFNGSINRDCRFCKHLDYLTGIDGFHLKKACCEIEFESSIESDNNPSRACCCANYEYDAIRSGAEDVIQCLKTYYEFHAAGSPGYSKVCDSAIGERLFHDLWLQSDHTTDKVSEAEKKYLKNLAGLIDEDNSFRIDPDYLFQAFSLANKRGRYVVASIERKPINSSNTRSFFSSIQIVLKLAEQLQTSID